MSVEGNIGFKKEQIGSEGLWSAIINAWPESIVINKKDNLPSNLNLCIALCPLYAPGDLADSRLIGPPLEIKDSRVVGKVAAYTKVLEGISAYQGSLRRDTNLNVVYANRGVIFKGQPTKTDEEMLAYGEGLYKGLFDSLCPKLGIKHVFSNFDDFGVNFPRFIDINTPAGVSFSPESVEVEHQVVAALNNLLNLPNSVEDNKDARRVVRGIMKQNGANGTFWLIAGYLPFDWMIPKIVGEGGMYIVAERADSLFAISKLTKRLNDLTRVQLRL